MPVTTSFIGVSDSFQGSEPLHLSRPERVAGLLAQIYPDLYWYTVPEFGIMRSFGYARRVPDAISPTLSFGTGDPVNTVRVSSLTYPSASYLALDMALTEQEGNGFGTLPLSITLNTNAGLDSLNDISLTPGSDYDGPDFFMSQIFFVCGNIVDIESGQGALGDWAVHQRVVDYANSNGGKAGIVSIGYLSLNTKTLVNKYRAYTYFYKPLDRATLVVENNSSRYLFRFSERPGLALRLEQPWFGEESEQPTPVYTFLNPSSSPKDLYVRDGFSRLYSFGFPVLEFKGGSDYSYPRLHGYEWRQGGYGGWKVGMI